MKRSFFQIIPYSIILFCINIFILFSFIEKEKEYTGFFKTKESACSKPSIDFNLIDCLNESNKKIIEISGIAFHKTNNAAMLRLLLKIRKNHQTIDFQLKNLTQDNLIIMAEPMYTLNINTDSLKEKNAHAYLSNLLETEIKTQISLLDELDKTSRNPDFKTFAVQSKKVLQNNYDELQAHLNI